ncbi:SIS domain-containing protein [Pseudomonas luteola]|uniref:SIS domain-containing protein n=1 Tax=Pseudomonas luteola TaxID=47886 RepID=UPI0012396C1D|nr:MULTISPECIES: SIS domain-containing protein [Pseudomonas]MBA1246212.1 SIS domain-containing protein [Pseudomonas zeshuii]QEU26916.1 SIS domain-containing protein [Pseudomonas luteola]
MLNFDEKRFINIQSGATEQAKNLGDLIGRLYDRGLENIFFVGAGGAGILMGPATQILKDKSTFPVFNEIAAELVLKKHRSLGEKSLVILPSLSGTTKETIAAAKYCKSLGATTISLVGHASSPLAAETDYNFINFAEDDTSCESFYIQSFAVAFKILECTEEAGAYKELIAEFEKLPNTLLQVKTEIETEAEKFAERFQREPYHIITGSGYAWAEAYYYGMCILEEMQWIKTRPVHASDFFHGTLELLEDNVSVLLMKGEDVTRPLQDRVEKFARTITQKVTVFDTSKYAADKISSTFRGYFSPILLATMLERVSCHLEKVREHPLTTRRYYRRIDY